MRVVKPFIALWFILSSLAALATDVVVMRDGSERSGRLELCEDAQCSLSGKRIPIEEIRAIYLDSPRKEHPVRSSAIVMRDGSVRTGRVTFLNRGTVDTDDEELDRSLVAAIIFSVASEKALSDLLILRNGSVKSGTLTTCNAASCTLDGGITPLANIEWVGLAREEVIPPSSAADEVHKIDGTIIPGRLSGINESSVSTTRGGVPRRETAWVHLAEPAAAPPDQPGSFGAPPPPPVQSPPPVGSPPPPPSPLPPPPVSPPPPSRPGTGALWTGTIRGRYWGTIDGTTSELLVTVDVKLRETAPIPLRAPGNPTVIGRRVNLDPVGSTITNKIAFSSRDLSCSGVGTTTHRGNTSGRLDGLLMTKTRNADTRQFAGIDIPLGRALYGVAYLVVVDEFPIECRSEGHTWTQKTGYKVPSFGRVGIAPVIFDSDSEFRFLQGTGTMVGSYQAPAERIMFEQMSAEWSICRAGTRCPPLPDGAAPPAPPGGTPDPGEPVDEDNDDDCVTLARLIDGMRALRDVYEGFEDAYKVAVEERDTARDAIYGFSGTLSQFSVSLGSLAAEAIGGAWGDLLGLLGSAAGLAQQNDLDSASQAVLAIADTNLAFTPAEIEGVRNAVRKADTYLAQTGDDQGALRVYSGELGRSEAASAKGRGVVKGLSIAVSIADYTEKTNALADSIQKYGDYRREANVQKANMDDVQDRMAGKQTEIDEVRKALDGPCPGIPSTNNVPQRNNLAEPRSPYRLVQSTANATSEPSATPEDVKSAASALGGVNEKLGRATPWLLPFLARETNGVSPKLLRALLRRAEPELRAVAANVDAAARAGRELERTMGGSSNSTTSRSPERDRGWAISELREIGAAEAR